MLEAADRQEVLIAGIRDQREDSEGDWGRGESGEGELLLGRVGQLEQGGELQHGDLLMSLLPVLGVTSEVAAA